jgi:hypothetical protein
MAAEDHALLRNDDAFKHFWTNIRRIRNGTMMPGIHGCLQHANGAYTIFPHQIPGIGGVYSGDWRLKWAQGFGPFVWTAGAAQGEARSAIAEVPILGPCEVLVGGGTMRVTDTHSGYTCAPDLPAESGVVQLSVPSGVSYRTIRLEALTPGACFYGTRTREPQPWLTGYRFDHSHLPAVGG